MPKIHLTAPDGNTFEFEITEAVTFGRAEGNDIIIPDGSVSSNHGEMIARGDSIEITDKGSTNGTFIDGERVENGLVHAGGSFKLGSVEGIVIAEVAAEEEFEEEAGLSEETEASEQDWNPVSGGGAPMSGYGATPCPAQLRRGFGPKKKVKDSSGGLIMTTAVLSLLACAAAAFMILKMAS